MIRKIKACESLVVSLSILKWGNRRLIRKGEKFQRVRSLKQYPTQGLGERALAIHLCCTVSNLNMQYFKLIQLCLIENNAGEHK